MIGDDTMTLGSRGDATAAWSGAGDHPRPADLGTRAGSCCWKPRFH